MTHAAPNRLPGRERLATCITGILCLARGAAAAPDSDAAKSEELGEITVTAQRRAQTTQDIPYNITAIGGAALDAAGAVGPNDLGRVVPGLVTVDSGPATRGGTNNLTLRGLRTDSPDGSDNTPRNVAAVSTYFGDTAVFFPIVLKDIDRIEVLRGPQGTLYGSGSEGGTIRIIPKRPSFDAFSGEVNAGTGVTERSGKPNANFDAVLNIPFNDVLAFRMVGGVQHLDGFIDDVNILERTGSGTLAGVKQSNPASPTSAPIVGPEQRDTNWSNQYFVRGSLRFAPSGFLDMQLDYVYQDTRVADLQASNPGYLGSSEDFAAGAPMPPTDSRYTMNGGGAYINTFPIRSPYENKVDLAALTTTLDFGLSTFTSVSSYYHNDTHAVSDTTSYYGSHDGGVTPGLITYYGNYPRFIAVTTDDNYEHTFSQEIRLVSNWHLPFDYVVGAYFQDQRTQNWMNQTAPGIAAYATYEGTPSASPLAGDQIYYIGRTAHFLDRAVFGELTGHLTSKWQVTGGFRVFSQDFSSGFVQESPFCGAACGDGITQPANLGLAVANNNSRVRNHIFKLNTSYDLSPDLKAYATYAQGFRRGGANGIPIAGYFRSLPQYETYQPDFARTYELGVKGALLDRRVRFDADIFWINLDNFQFSTSTPSYEGGVFNGAQARSRGGEMELTADLTRRLKASFAYTYTLAQVSKTSTLTDYPIYSILTGAQPSVYLTLDKGASLPGVPKHTLNAAFDYSLPLVDSSALILHADASYRSSALGAIDPTSAEFWHISSITVVNTLFTYDSGGPWRVGFSINNVLGKLGYTAGIQQQTFDMPWYARTVMRPRTYGISGHYSF